MESLMVFLPGYGGWEGSVVASKDFLGFRN